MLVDRKHTSCYRFSFRDFLNRGMVHTSWIGWLLPLGVGTFLSKVPHLVAVIARTLGRIVDSRCCSLNCLWLGRSYRRLVRLLLRWMPGVPPLRWSEPSTWGRRTILLSPCHWCPGLRRPGFKSPLTRLGCTIVVVIVLLGQTVTDVSIEGSPASCTHGFQHLWAQTPLETGDLLGLRVHKLGGVASEIVESV